jgi:hypothetical protein
MPIIEVGKLLRPNVTCGLFENHGVDDLSTNKGAEYLPHLKKKIAEIKAARAEEEDSKSKKNLRVQKARQFGRKQEQVF